jgi:hypothetical protein
MKYIVIGQIGSDAGYWTLENGHWVHHGGWSPEALAEVSRAVQIMSEAARMKTPGLADSVTKSVLAHVDKELNSHLGDQLKQGAIIIIGG